jgi:hypothetical protein
MIFKIYKFIMSGQKEKCNFKIINSLVDSYKKTKEKINTSKTNNLPKMYKDKSNNNKNNKI